MKTVDTNTTTKKDQDTLPASVQITCLRLLRSHRVGVSTYHKLIKEYGTAAAALEALPQIAAQKGVVDYKTCPLEVAAKEFWSGHKMGAKLVHLGQKGYPAPLANIIDAPPLLWLYGKTSVLSRPMIAMVGARNASALGTRMARKMAQELSEAGITVVSGLARGIDTAAHLGSLAHGTIAVHAGGVDMCYPRENSQLAKDIAKTGLRVSEQPIGLFPQARHFPSRNRLISGLCSAVVVVEAAAKSGSLITAKDALDQGREVMAVPGHPFDGRSFGSNALIRDGALLIRNAADVLSHICFTPIEKPMQQKTQLAEKPAPPLEERTLREVAALHKLILSRLSPAPIAEDQLIRELKQPAALIMPALSELEINGKIERQTGGFVCRI